MSGAEDTAWFYCTRYNVKIDRYMDLNSLDSVVHLKMNNMVHQMMEDQPQAIANLILRRREQSPVELELPAEHVQAQSTTSSTSGFDFTHSFVDYGSNQVFTPSLCNSPEPHNDIN